MSLSSIVHADPDPDMLTSKANLDRGMLKAMMKTLVHTRSWGV